MGLMQAAPCSTLETEVKGRSCAAMIGTLGKEGRRLVLEDVKVNGEKKNALEISARQANGLWILLRRTFFCTERQRQIRHYYTCCRCNK
jgi:hypothetical protein